MMFDPLWLIVVGPTLLVAFYAQFKVMSTFKKYSRIRVASGQTGAAVAQLILDRAGIRDVSVERISSMLGDHYDPRQKVLRLSPDVYDGNSISAVGVAAHECGHALQHAQGYAPLHLRSVAVPLAMGAQFGSQLLPVAVILCIVFKLLAFLPIVIYVAIVVFAIITFFSLITLPVEFNASSRAKAILQQMGTVNREEAAGVNKVLSAAAFTYVAAFIMSLANMFYWILKAQSRRD